jgi:hypothetical protein
VALPTVVAVGAVSAVIGTACAPGVHAGNLADDIQVLFVEAQNEPLNAITGFTRIGSTAVVQATGMVTDLSAFWKRSVGGDTAPSITSTPQNHLIARIVGVRGCVTSGSPVHISNTGLDNTTGTTVTIPGATTTVADCLVFAAFSTGADSNTSQLSGSFTNAALGSITTQVNNWTNSGGGGGFAACSGTKAAAGAYGNTTATVTANTKAMMSFALQGATGGGAAAKPKSINYRSAVNRSYTW